MAPAVPVLVLVNTGNFEPAYAFRYLGRMLEHGSEGTHVVEGIKVDGVKELCAACGEPCAGHKAAILERRLVVPTVFVGSYAIYDHVDDFLR